jgi:predicted acetyltransferase
MSLTLKWVGKEAAEVVGQTRALCYAPATREAPEFQQRLANDARVTGDDLLIAHRDGTPVGTTTSYSMTMWIRGQSFPCQGVAWVGTVKTHRRSGGVASSLMGETLRKARERGQVISALMPFRASFYEHFGYGLVERRNTWTIPLSVLPTEPMGQFSFITGADDARRDCWQHMVQNGQCQIERDDGAWSHWITNEGESYVVADQPKNEPMRSWFVWSQQQQNGKEILSVNHLAYDSLESLRRGLSFFATLKDQYWAVKLNLPADLQLFRLFKETQVPLRPTNHETAETKYFTRMQARVLDHARLINGLRLPDDVRGQATVAIHETEGTTTTLRIEFAGGRGNAAPTTARADIECADKQWAAIVLGDLSATRAAELGLIKPHSPQALRLLDAFAAGPAPFCSEYF